MILLLIITVPVCIELAAWLVDSAWETHWLSQPQTAQVDVE